MQAVILAGGRGSRLHPLTETIPKTMIPILNRPLLEYPLSKFADYGIDEVFLTLHHLPESISNYFGSGQNFDIALRYALEERPMGTAGGVKSLESHFTGTIVVSNGDVFTNLDLSRAISFHREKGAIATIVLTQVDSPSAFGMVETDSDHRILGFVEKPLPEQVTTNWINAGTYILEPGALSYVPDKESCMFERDLFPNLLDSHAPVYGFPSRAYWMDLGTPVNYLKLHNDLLYREITTPLSDLNITGSVTTGKQCEVHQTAEIHGPLMVGSRTIIQAKAQIRGPVTLGNDCLLGSESMVQGIVAWDRVIIGEAATVSCSILGNDVVIGPGAKVEAGSVLADQVRVRPGVTVAGGTKAEPGIVL